MIIIEKEEGGKSQKVIDKKQKPEARWVQLQFLLANQDIESARANAEGFVKERQTRYDHS